MSGFKFGVLFTAMAATALSAAPASAQALQTWGDWALFKSDRVCTLGKMSGGDSLLTLQDHSGDDHDWFGIMDPALNAYSLNGKSPAVDTAAMTLDGKAVASVSTFHFAANDRGPASVNVVTDPMTPGQLVKSGGIRVKFSLDGMTVAEGVYDFPIEALTALRNCANQ